MTTTEQTIPILYLFLIILVTTLTAPVLAQSVSISAELTSTELVAGDDVDLVLSTEGPADVYFFSVETSFDNDIFEFTGVQTTDLTEGGIAIADYLSSGVVGASVTRTTPLGVINEGGLMILSFKVKSKTPVGNNSFTFSLHTLANSGGTAISSDIPEPAEFEIEESIALLELTTSAMIDITEGDEFYATGRVFANGVTNEEENTDRIRMWIGVNDDNSDPSTWNENVWQLMEFTEQDSEDFFHYSKDIGYQLDSGVHYISVRSELDENGDYRYGGINGYWDDIESPSAVIEIMQQPPYRYTIAAWDFDDESLIASQGVPVNQMEEAELFGASHNGYGAGASERAANSNNWHDYAESTNYWQVSISTENFESLRISSKQTGSGTGPRDFKLQSSLDGLNWTDVPGGTIEVANNWTAGVLDQISLPDALEDQSEIYIRWVQTSVFQINQSETNTDSVSTTGTNRIDDIIITGINPNADRVNVWPGDTDNNGEVDEVDVLPLGAYWLTAGPAPIHSSFDWEPREVEAWIPEMATYADAAGTGRVDQNDLQLVGLNFGKTHDNAAKINDNDQNKMKFSNSVQLELEPLQAGQTAEIFLAADGGTDLSGISFRIDFPELNAEQWFVERVEPLGWGEIWYKDDRMIKFQTVRNDFLAVSLVHKGITKPVKAKNLVRIVVRAKQSWNHPVTAQLRRAFVSSGYDIKELNNAELNNEMSVSIGSPVDDLPRVTKLLPNYPNPFNPVTTIPYSLSEPGDVEIRIYDSIGRQILTINKEALQPGSYAFDFDASSLSSGIYFYQMRANGILQTRRMSLVK